MYHKDLETDSARTVGFEGTLNRLLCIGDDTIIATEAFFSVVLCCLPCSLERSVKMDGVRVQDVLKEYNGPKYEIETRLMVFRSINNALERNDVNNG
ncbi:hypothetical protein Tco_0551112 [Tanacetum coccineum]